MTDTSALVIGSGFGGAAAALRLGQAGIDTVLLERGRRWDITDPTRDATFATFEKPDGRANWLSPVTVTPAGYEGTPIDRYAGVLEVSRQRGIALLAGAGVGGSSLVYGGIMVQPPRELFRQVFPAELDYDELDRVHFPRVRSVIKKMGPVPDDVLAAKNFTSARVFRDHALRAGYPETSSTKEFHSGICKIDMAIDWDVIRDEMAGRAVPSMSVGQVWYGANSGAKQSVDRNYLRDAEATGKVRVLPLHVVKEISERPGGGYRVVVEVIDEGGTVLEQRTLGCGSLFLAAGSAGTNGLLVRAKAKGWLPRLNEHVGQNVGNDGDVFLFRDKLAETTYPYLGMPGVLALCDYDNPHNPTVMMKVDLPRFAEVFPDSKGLGLFCFVMTPNRGRYVYDGATDGVVLEFEPDPPLAATHLAEKLCRAAGGAITSVTSRFTGHQIGGANMGLVCDVDGRVKGYQNLYVVDGALMPGSTTCVNPAWTIAAVAERCLERILAEDLRR